MSAASIARLKAQWLIEFQEWRDRSFAELDIVYCRADGLYVNAGIEDGKTAVLETEATGTNWSWKEFFGSYVPVVNAGIAYKQMTEVC